MIKQLQRSACLLAIAAMANGCQLPNGPCVEDQKAGDRIRVHLLEPYDETSQFNFDKTFAGEDYRPSCAGIDGVVTPAVLEFEIMPEKRADDGCTFRMADLVGGTTIVPPVGGQGSRNAVLLDGAVLAIVFSASLTQPLESGCKAQWLGNLIAPNGKEGLYSAPVPGTLPPGIFGRRRTTCADSADTCVDYFAAKVERLP